MLFRAPLHLLQITVKLCNPLETSTVRKSEKTALQVMGPNWIRNSWFHWRYDKICQTEYLAIISRKLYIPVLVQRTQNVLWMLKFIGILRQQANKNSTWLFKFSLSLSSLNLIMLTFLRRLRGIHRPCSLEPHCICYRSQ